MVSLKSRVDSPSPNSCKPIPLIFSFVNAFQVWLQIKGINIPSDFAVMLPYILTIVALVFAVRQNQRGC